MTFISVRKTGVPELIAEDIDQLNNYIQIQQFDLKLAEIILREIYIATWKLTINQNKKALLYKSIKLEFHTEPYVFRVNNKRNRSLLSRLRAGCLDLEIETGRWRGVERENRVCKLCNNGIENEIHFLFQCCKLDHIRKQYSKILEYNDEIQCDIDLFKYLCTDVYVIQLSKMIRQLYDERKQILYR